MLWLSTYLNITITSLAAHTQHSIKNIEALFISGIKKEKKYIIRVHLPNKRDTIKIFFITVSQNFLNFESKNKMVYKMADGTITELYRSITTDR